MASKSEFPKYIDGDVGIMITPTKSYQLHSAILQRGSTWFAKELIDPPRLNSKAKSEHLPAYRFELQMTGNTGVGRLVRKTVTESGRVIDSGIGLTDLDGNRISEVKARYWDSQFRTYYSIAPDFDDHNLATVLSGCMGLIDVAEIMGSVDRVREPVDHALLRQDKVLWQSIAGNPTAWVELGRRVHSHIIFKEGMVHCIGKWNLLSEDEKNNMHEQVRQICQLKADELATAKEAIEMRILGHYPSFLSRLAADKPGRPSYANDIYMWMSICFFRQYFAQAISDRRTRMAADGGFDFYNALAKGGQQYLHHEDFANFHQYFPMSSKACNVLEANMGVLKEDVKQFVADLVKVRVHLNLEESTIKWLTCAMIEKEDYPWYVPEEDKDSAMDQDGSVLGVENGDDTPEPDAIPTPPLQIRSRRPAQTSGSMVDDNFDQDADGDMDADDERAGPSISSSGPPPDEQANAMSYYKQALRDRTP